MSGWDMNYSFIIGYSFSDVVIAGLDSSLTSDKSWVKVGESWDKWSDLVDNPEVELTHGDWGISAIIIYEGAGVSYNVYRDDDKIASDLSESSYADSNVENNNTYEYEVSATYSDGEESDKSEPVSAIPVANTVYENSHDDGSFESEFNAGAGNFSAVKYSANSQGEDIVRFKWYQIGNGGAFYIKIFEDNEEAPGNEIFSSLQASGNVDGWNEKDLSSEGLNVTGDFWIGAKEFSSSKPFGLDENSNAGVSYKRIGNTGDWLGIEGNLMYRIFLDCGENCEDGARRVADDTNFSNELYSQVPVYKLNFINKNPFLMSVKINGNLLYRKQNAYDQLNRMNASGRNEIILLEYNLESDDEDGWIGDEGWILTELESNSPTHSYNSPNENIDGLEIEGAILPSSIAINKIFPNPFNPIANIQFEVSISSKVRLSIYNLNGSVVKTLVNDNFNPGNYAAIWNGMDGHGIQAASGIYFAVLRSDNRLFQTQKLVLLK